MLALALLFGQAAGFAHALSHLDPRDGALSDKVCEVCIAQANLGSAAPGHLSCLSIVPGNPIGMPDLAPPLVSALVQAALARAPPAAI